MDGKVDLDLVNDWLGMLLNDRWQDLYRMKGVLAIEGCDDRCLPRCARALRVCPTGPGKMVSHALKLVFIGKELDREELKAGFEAAGVGGAAACGAAPDVLVDVCERQGAGRMSFSVYSLENRKLLYIKYE